MGIEHQVFNLLLLCWPLPEMIRTHVPNWKVKPCRTKLNEMSSTPNWQIGQEEAGGCLYLPGKYIKDFVISYLYNR